MVCLELSKLHLAHLIYSTKEIFENAGGEMEVLLSDTDSGYLKVSNIYEPYKLLEKYPEFYNLCTFPRRYNFAATGKQIPGKLSYDIDMK